MKNFKKNSMVIMLSTSLIISMIWQNYTFASDQLTVSLLTSNDFAILSETAITDVPSSIINWNVWASPITGAAIGLSCSEVTWTIYSVDAAGPLPCRVTDAWLLGTAITHMEAAYNDAAGRAFPDQTELNWWNIGWLTITPGLYKWSTDVNIATDITISGDSNDVWIFQISWNLTIASAKKIKLFGWANAWNIFWQVDGPVGATLGTDSTFNWTILSSKQIILQTNAILNWRAFAQTQVTLDHNTINVPTSNPTLHVIKEVVNNWGSSGVASDFTLYVKSSWVDAVTPAVWVWTPWSNYSLVADTYIVSEDANSNYTQTFSWDCNSSGLVTLSGNDDKTCTVINTHIQWSSSHNNYTASDYSSSTPIVESTGTTDVPTTPEITPIISTTASTGTTVVPTTPDIDIDYDSAEDEIDLDITPIKSVFISTGSTITTPEVTPIIEKTPGFPNTGFQDEKNNNWIITIITSIILLILLSLSIIFRKNII